MERIKSLYSAFSRYESRIFKTYLSAFHNKGENKALQLVELIEKNPEITLEKASKKLYEDPRSKAFLMLKARLYEKMTEFLSLSISTSALDKEEIDPLNAAQLEYRKAMLAALALRMRGLKGLATDFLERALEISREINTPELELDSLLRLKAIRGQRKHPNEENELFLELSDVLGKLETDLNAIAIYHHMFELFTLKTGEDDKRDQYLERNIPQLDEMLAKNYSVRAEYYIVSLKIIFYGTRRQYDECKAAIDRQIHLVSTYKGLQNKERMSTPWHQLGLLEANAGKTEASLEALAKCAELTRDTPHAHWQVMLSQAYVMLHGRKLDEAERLLEALSAKTKDPSAKIKPEQAATVDYLNACQGYLRKNPRRAWQQLQAIEEVNFDRAGWNTGFRIFGIMLLIELNEPDMVALKLESLRKHLARYGNQDRSQVIYRILQSMEKNGFNFAEVKNEKKLLDELETKYSWNLMGHELIRFDTWYRSHRGMS